MKRVIALSPFFLFLLFAEPASLTGETGLRSNLDLPYNAGAASGEEDEEIVEVITFYGESYKANAVVFCLDASNSMKKANRWEVQKREVTQAINELSQGAEFGLVLYHGSVAAFRSVLVRASTENKQAAVAFLNSHDLDRQTCMERAVMKSFKILSKSARSHRAVIVAGDGRPTQCGAPEMNREGVMRGMLQRTRVANPGGRMRLHTILVGEKQQGGDVEFMRDLARTHRGTFRSAK